MTDDLSLFEFLEANLLNTYSTSQGHPLELFKDFTTEDETRGYGDNTSDYLVFH